VEENWRSDGEGRIESGFLECSGAGKQRWRVLEEFKVMGGYYHVGNVNRENGLGGNPMKFAEEICAGNTVGGKREQKRNGERRDVNGDKEGDDRKGKRVEIVREGMVVGKVKIRKQRWRIMGVYVNGNMGEYEILQDLEGWMEEKEKRVLTLIEGDFNAREKEEVMKMEGERDGDRREERRRKRRTKDIGINWKGKL